MRRLMWLCAIILSGCASTGGEAEQGMNDPVSHAQYLYDVEQFVVKWHRLNDVHNKVMEANAELCERRHLSLGVVMHQLSDYPIELQEFVLNHRDVEEFPTILSVQEESLKAVLQPGDVILNRHDEPTLPYTYDVQHYMIAGFIRILRDGNKMILPVQAPKACSYRPSLKKDKCINASAENGEISVTTGLMDIAMSDDELGFFISHELAHYVKGHVQIIMHGDVAPSQKGREKTSKEQEVEADYAGLYYAARAGFYYKKVNDFWERIKTPALFNFFSFLSSYPNIQEREVFLTRIGEEIDQKVKTNQSIEP